MLRNVETAGGRRRGVRENEVIQSGIPGVFPNSVTDDIVDLAVLGQLPTEGFSEIYIATRLGATYRGIARAAMGTLVHDGVLGVRPQSGYWLLEASIEVARVSLKCRSEAVESLMQHISSRSSQTSIGNLQVVLYEMSRETEPQRFIKLESQFYSQLAVIARERFTAGLIEGCNNRLRIFHAAHPVTTEQMAGKIVWAETLADLTHLVDKHPIPTVAYPGGAVG